MPGLLNRHRIYAPSRASEITEWWEFVSFSTYIKIGKSPNYMRDEEPNVTECTGG